MIRVAGHSLQSLVRLLIRTVLGHRPLSPPRFGAERDLRAFLSDPGARARALAPLAGALRIDVLFADSGCGWNGEAMGLFAGWVGGWPPTLHPGPSMGAFDPGCDARRILADLLARLGAVIPAVALGVALTGPATLPAASGGTLSSVSLKRRPACWRRHATSLRPEPESEPEPEPER